jgi:hypothetical protein
MAATLRVAQGGIEVQRKSVSFVVDESHLKAHSSQTAIVKHETRELSQSDLSQVSESRQEIDDLKVGRKKVNEPVMSEISESASSASLSSSSVSDSESKMK